MYYTVAIIGYWTIISKWFEDQTKLVEKSDGLSFDTIAHCTVTPCCMATFISFERSAWRRMFLYKASEIWLLLFERL